MEAFRGLVINRSWPRRSSRTYNNGGVGTKLKASADVVPLASVARRGPGDLISFFSKTGITPRGARRSQGHGRLGGWRAVPGPGRWRQASQVRPTAHAKKTIALGVRMVQGSQGQGNRKKA